MFAVGSHDTASAAAVTLYPKPCYSFLSSGTWSLMVCILINLFWTTSRWNWISPMKVVLTIKLLFKTLPGCGCCRIVRWEWSRGLCYRLSGFDWRSCSCEAISGDFRSRWWTVCKRQDMRQAIVGLLDSHPSAGAGYQRRIQVRG